ncbi:phage head spike fiber domain-containing protein [Devosia sp.]|uniref:phage head spike fiber domain-containing protein n=1 Tax=Devosia sp. TaxID=1871048 RepID=UPI003A599596
MLGISLWALPPPLAWWPPDAVWAVDFVQRRAMLAGLPADFASSFGISRAGGKLVRNGQGRFEAVGANTASLTEAGLLVEDAGSNLCTYAADPSQAAWFRNSITLASGLADPAGADGAWLITETGGGAALSRQPMSITQGATYSLTRIVRRGNFDWMRVTVGDASFAGATLCWYNLSTAAAGSVSQTAGGFGHLSQKIEQLADGYIAITQSFVAPGTQLNISLTSAAADGSTTRADLGSGPGMGGQYGHWMTQLELGAASSLMISGVTPASRPAEQLVLPDAPTSGTLTAVFSDGTSQSLSLAAPLPASFAKPVIARLVATP